MYMSLKKEKEMEAKGYRLYTTTETNQLAKEIAALLRQTGKKAFVGEESRRGVPHYSVWCK